jgi:hypothetical protein
MREMRIWRKMLPNAAKMLVNFFLMYKQDLFVYITIKRYTPKEFYSVIINIGASKKSTTDNNIDINIMQTRAINV